jgi:hypothetical protein
VQRQVGRQQAEIEDPRFGVDHPIPMGSWMIPATLNHEGGQLRYQWLHSEMPHLRFAEKGPTMLKRFLALESAEPEQILRYASEFGTLHLCAHGLPNTHNLSGRNAIPRVSRYCACDTVTAGEWTIEPLDDWRALSRQANAMLDLAVQIDRGESGSHDLWSQLPYFLDYDDPGEATYLPPPPDVVIARLVFASLVDTWLDWAQIRPSFSWGDHGALVNYYPVGLFGALAMQLATRIGRVSPTAICSFCSNEYEPTRAPKHGQRNFCPNCRAQGVPNMLAKRDARENERKRREKEGDG